VAGVAVPDAAPPLGVHVPFSAAGAVVSSSRSTGTPSIWQAGPLGRSTPAPLQSVEAKPCTTAPVHDAPAGEPHEHPLQARESLTPV
jgi:hypothetical protein